MTDRERVLRHLENHGSITPLEALDCYGIMRLAAVVCNLRKDGYEINTIMMQGTDRFGEPMRYAKYVLLGGADGATDEQGNRLRDSARLAG